MLVTREMIIIASDDRILQLRPIPYLYSMTKRVKKASRKSWGKVESDYDSDSFSDMVRIRFRSRCLRSKTHDIRTRFRKAERKMIPCGFAASGGELIVKAYFFLNCLDV